jgi:hypothetical protein
MIIWNHPSPGTTVMALRPFGTSANWRSAVLERYPGNWKTSCTR